MLSVYPPKNLSARQHFHEALRRHLRTDGPFTLSSGGTADWYLDARQLTFDGRGARIVADAVLEVLDPDSVAIGGMTMGADPIALATAMTAADRERPLRAFSIRKTEKDHGIGGRLVGPVSEGDTVVIVEDTTTTGSAFFGAIDVAAEAGLVVSQAVVLLDRSGGAVADEMRARDIPYVALATPSDLGVA